MGSKFSNIKKFFYKPWKIFIVILAAFVMINSTVEGVYGINMVQSGIRKVLEELGFYFEEQKLVSFEHEGYKDDVAGSFKVDKSADWISKDTAMVKFDIHSALSAAKTNKDVVFVLDTSGSMSGDKINLVKEHTLIIAEKLLKEEGNSVALIRFDTDASVLSRFTSDFSVVENAIKDLKLGLNTNYYAALKEANKLLRGYRKAENKDLIILFLTDGYPNLDNPNQRAQYKLLKKRYPYASVEGIQYEMGIDVVDDIKSISDEQFVMNLEQVNNILFEAVYNPDYYEELVLEDVIDNEYFYLESVDDVTVPFGTVELTEDGGNQKIVWTVSKDDAGKYLWITGTTATLEMKLKLQDKYVDKDNSNLDKENFYPTNVKEKVTANLPGQEPMVVESDLTPVLEGDYTVTYHSNSPSGCEETSISDEHYAYDNVEMIETKPTCEGYVFKGYRFAKNQDGKIKKVNSDVFVMPSSNVDLYGEWTKVSISKDVEGTMVERNSLYKHIASLAKGTDENLNYKKSSLVNDMGVYQVSGSDVDGKEPIYFYRGTAEETHNNIVLGDYCWLIMRTTETGGVKILYNGKRSTVDGSCLAHDEGTKTEHVIGQVQWNKYWRNFAYQGYTYSSEFNENSYVVRNSTSSYYVTSSRYWSKKVSYADGKYTLVDTYKGTAGNAIANGYHYTCDGTSTTQTSCTTVRYASGIVSGSHIYIDAIKNGDDINTLFAKMQGEGLDKDTDIESPAKTKLENWFANNMTDLQYMLEDTPYCNDRTITNDGLGGWLEGSETSTTALYFATYERAENGTPTNSCSVRDSYTVSTENGNGLLNYPVGLMTVDEMMYAGGFYDQDSNTNPSWYVYIDKDLGNTFNQLSFSPGYYSGEKNTDSESEGPNMFRKIYAGSNGEIAGWDLNFNGWSSTTTGYYLRPVVSLKPGVMLLAGEGTTANPYVLVT